MFNSYPHRGIVGGGGGVAGWNSEIILQRNYFTLSLTVLDNVIFGLL